MRKNPKQTRRFGWLASPVSWDSCLTLQLNQPASTFVIDSPDMIRLGKSRWRLGNWGGGGRKTTMNRPHA